MRFKKLLWHSDADYAVTLCRQLSTKTFPHSSTVHTTIITSTSFRLQGQAQRVCRRVTQPKFPSFFSKTAELTVFHYFWLGQEQIKSSVQSLLTSVN